MATRNDFCSFEDVEGRCATLSTMPGVTPDDVDDAISSASDLIWTLTGRQYGTYSETIRPDLLGVPSPTVELRRFPVNSIQSVKIDGAVINPSEYWVVDGRALSRTDGMTWPITQKLYLDDSQEGTFSVSLTWGTPPPSAVSAAARRLACELLNLKFGGPSGLPERVRSTVRQGISMEHVSVEDLLDNGRTGIFEIDLVISTYNRDETAALPAVMSPDIGWYSYEGTSTVGGGYVQQQLALGDLTNVETVNAVAGSTLVYDSTSGKWMASQAGPVLVLGANDPVPPGYVGLIARLPQ